MQVIKLYEQPILAEEIGQPPLTLQVITTPKRQETVNGPTSTSQKLNTYVLYDVLPDELKRRVKLAIETLTSQF